MNKGGSGGPSFYFNSNSVKRQETEPLLRKRPKMNEIKIDQCDIMAHFGTLAALRNNADNASKILQTAACTQEAIDDKCFKYFNHHVQTQCEKAEVYQCDVTGLDFGMLLAALHNNTKVTQTAVCVYQASKFAMDSGRPLYGECSDEDARPQLQWPKDSKIPQFPSYLFGRLITVHLEEIQYIQGNRRVFLTRCEKYDEVAGKGKALRVVNRLRQG